MYKIAKGMGTGAYYTLLTELCSAEENVSKRNARY